MKPLTESSTTKQEPSILKICIETALTVVYALLIALTLRTFGIEPFKIPSGSMLPNLLIGDFLFVSKYSYGYSRYSFPLGIIPFDGRIMSSTPKRGDVVVFRSPRRPDINYVKRVFGLPGETIQLKSGVLFINDTPARRTETALPEYIRPTGRAKAYLEVLPGAQHGHVILETDGDFGLADNTSAFTVPEGHYFMMGDNRDNSSDSRFLNDLGYVPLDYIIGPVEFIFYSHDFSNGFKVRFSRFFKVVH